MDQVVLLVLIGCFADDTRLSKALRAGFTEEDMLALQTDLLNVVKWALDNNMELNESKFDLLCYSYRPAAELLKSLPFIQNLFQYETPDGSTVMSAVLMESGTFVLACHLITLGLSILAPLLKMVGRCSAGF